MAFEYTAESYRASAGFSAVGGRNQWYYRSWDEKHYENLQFVDFARTVVHDAKTGRTDEHRSFANYWGDDDSCRVGDNFQIPAGHRAVRTWVAPHRGRVRVEWTVHIENDREDGVKVSILHNDREAWSSPFVGAVTTGAYDIAIDVQKGDAIDFAERPTGKNGEKVTWDPVITYEDK
jgi:hypothetical protein